VHETFVDAFIRGVCTIDELEDWIERWHNGSKDDISLADYLGMTDDEYAGWVNDWTQIEKAIERRKAELSAS
jgi:hypothetical protein